MKVYGPLRKAQLEKVTKPEDLNVPIDGRIFMDDTLTNPNDENSGKNTPTITLGTTNKEILLSGDAVIHGSANVADTPKPTGVSTSHIVPGSITTADLADGAVTAPKLQRAESIGAALRQGGEPGAVEGTYDDANHLPIYGNIKPKSIGKYELKDKSVIESKLADNAVTGAKIANDTVTEDKLSRARFNLRLGEYSGGAVKGSTTKPGSNEIDSAGNIQHQTIGNYELALGAILGTNMAVGTIGSREIKNNSIVASDLAKANRPESGGIQSTDSGAVEGTIIGVNPDKSLKYTYGNIKPGSIGRTELRNDCITPEKINPGAVTKDKLDTNAVTTGKINSLAVTEDKLADDAVTRLKLADDAVTTGKINSIAVTETKIKDDAVTEDKIKNDAVTEDKIANNAVTAPKLQKATKVLGPTETTSQKDDDGAVQGTYQDGRNPDSTPKYVFGNIKPHSIDRFELKNDCVTTEKINPGAVTEDKLADDAVTRLKLADDAVTTGKINSIAVTETKIKDDAVTEDKIKNDAVTEDKIANNAVTGAKIADYSAISADNSPGITTDKIADKAVTRAKLSKAVTDELDTIGSGSASTGGAFLVATIGPLINMDNNPASPMDHPQDLNIRWVFDSAFPAERVDQTTRTAGTARPLNSYYLYSRPSDTRNGYLYIPMMHKDPNVIGYKIILEKKTGTDSNNVDIREPISQVFIPLPDATLGQQYNDGVIDKNWFHNLKTANIRRAEHVLKINKTFAASNVQYLKTNTISIEETITSGIGPDWPTLMGSYLGIGSMNDATGTPKIKLYCYEIRV